MDYQSLLTRRITHPGCVVAGTKLAAHHADIVEALKKEKDKDDRKLTSKVETSVLLVIKETKVLEGLSTTDATMTEVDRGADRCIAGFDNTLDALQRMYDHESVLPLTDEESARLADITLVRSSVLPQGTDFLRLVYSLQWVRMSAMMEALASTEVASAVKRLGLTPEVARLRRWADLYGEKLGVTARKQADPVVAALEAWHEAYGELFAHVLSDYNDRKRELHAKVRDALLSPYNDIADEERRADQKARAKRKAKNG